MNKIILSLLLIAAPATAAAQLFDSLIINREKHYNIGVEYNKKGKHQKALDKFNQLVKIDKGNSKYHYHRGLTYFLLKDNNKAKKDIDYAISLNSGKNKKLLAEMLLARMTLRIKEGDYDNAIADIELMKKLGVNSNHAAKLIEIVNNLKNQG